MSVRPNARRTLLLALTRRIARLHPQRRLLVALDGPDASGRSRLATDLAALVATVRPVQQLRACDWARAGDGDERPAGGAGGLDDPVDLEALLAGALHPAAPHGDGRVRLEHPGAGDPLDAAPLVALDPRSALVTDGAFLLRPELRGLWDLSIRLTVRDPGAARRIHGRAGPPPPDMAAGGEPGGDAERRYLAVADPDSHADVLVDMTDARRPVLRRA